MGFAFKDQDSKPDDPDANKIKENCNCAEFFNCCDCGGDSDCGCPYCWSCNACTIVKRIGANNG